MGCLWPKYILFESKKYRGVMFDGTEYWCNENMKENWVVLSKTIWVVLGIFIRAIESLQIGTFMLFFSLR